MDLKTGKTYNKLADALADGAARSDVAQLACSLDKVEQRLREGKPVVKFSKGSFKSLIRTGDGELVKP